MEGKALDMYKVGVAEIKRRAMKELGLPESEIVVRSLRPEDIGLTTPEWTDTAGSAAWADYVSTTVGDQKFILINGTNKSEAYITQVRITREGKVAAIWNIQACEKLRDNSLFFEPVLCDQNTLLHIEQYGPGGSTEELILFGAVAEPKGLTINP